VLDRLLIRRGECGCPVGYLVCKLIGRLSGRLGRILGDEVFSVCWVCLWVDRLYLDLIKFGHRFGTLPNGV